MQVGYRARHLARKVRHLYTPMRVAWLAVCFMLVTGGVSWADIALTTTAADDAVVVDQVGASLIDVLANDDVAVGGTLSITDATPATSGTVVIATDGLSLTYEPGPDFCGDGLVHLPDFRRPRRHRHRHRQCRA